MSIVRSLILFFVLCFSVFEAFAQSPWVNSQGSFYSQLSLSHLSYDSFINNDVSDIISADFTTTDITLGMFGEYSLTDKTSAILDLPFKSVTSDGQSLMGLGDTRIRIKHQISSRIPFAVFYGYTAPLSQREVLLRTGYGQHALELGISLGVGKENFYAYGSLGYKYRVNIPDQVMIDAEIGFNSVINDKTLFVILSVNGLLNTSSTADEEGEQTMLYHNNGEYLSPGVKLSYNIFNDFWINVGGFGAIKAQKLGASPSVNIGVAYNLKG